MSGLLAEFPNQTAMTTVAKILRAEIGGEVTTHSPSAPEIHRQTSALPIIMLIAGVLGSAATFAMQWYADVISYPMNVGGRPDFSWPAYIPMTFEFGVLASVAAGVIGFLVVNRLPYLYDPIDELDEFRRVSSDGWFVALRSDDGAALGRARAVMAPFEPRAISELPS